MHTFKVTDAFLYQHCRGLVHVSLVLILSGIYIYIYMHACLHIIVLMNNEQDMLHVHDTGTSHLHCSTIPGVKMSIDSCAELITSKYTSREWSGEKKGVTVHCCPHSAGSNRLL